MCGFVARGRFLGAYIGELFIHLKPKAFENLNAMAWGWGGRIYSLKRVGACLVA